MTVLTTAGAAREDESSSAAAVVRRADLDGLRALAIALVVVYHVWVGRVSGGVDVFLFLSAFFLTGSFLRRMERRESLRLGSYWARRFSSLVPAAAATILGVVTITALVYPPERWRAVWNEAVGSIFYVQNRVLADSAVDYYARSDQTSPLQHFWSLAVQGQVFLLWPILLAVAALIVSRTRLSPAAAVSTIFATVFAASFAYSVVITPISQQTAYFDTGARLWEFALGSLIAVLVTRVTLPAVWRPIAVAVGLVGIVSCGAVLDVEGAFPGWVALWPVASAALVVMGGTGRTQPAASRMLSSAPMLWLARISYALYLGHWPVLITWGVVTDATRPGLFTGGVLIGISLLLAWAMTRLLIEPVDAALRRRGTAARVIAIVVSVVLVVAPVLTWRHLQTTGSTELGPEHPGASAVLTGEVTAQFDEPPRPSAADLAWPWFEPGKDCRDDLAGAQETCFHLAGSDADSFRVAVVGNSHSQQWGGVLEPLALEQGWDLFVLAAGGCPVGLDDDGTRPPGVCASWREVVMESLATIRPDLIVTVGSASSPSTTDEHVSAGLDRAIQQMQELTGADVLVLRDNPRFEFDMYECGEQADTVSECEVPLVDVQAETNPLAEFDAWDAVSTVDLTPLVCPEGVCRPVVGNIRVYFDDNHLTIDYVRSMSWAISEMIPS
ncbi:acyltransferase family protein [Microbacterium thalli]|uniref:Acyltransferase family protein n=1 Tax=Microbacterium thalli TaxID=3027921 RepID=A0ABT5SH57_9MICO|nr:acyltransferase family protein [Microbacterium thalli]MDD7962159.1 acyltransferase family protein [Microbacterium thalli]